MSESVLPATDTSSSGDASKQLIERTLQHQRDAYRDQPMPSAEQRIDWLNTLKRALLSRQENFVAAIDRDFNGRSRDETLMAELMPSVQGINYARRHLKRWMKSQRRFAGLQFLPAAAKVVYQPLGVAGIVVPWNYPLFLAIGPLTSALAAGNRVMIKMSEFTPQSSQLFADMIKENFPAELITVINGDAETAAHFTQQAFDHLLFTGATSIGHHVMRAASENLTPVTLELGGKSPVIIGSDVALPMAAERICFGKSMNAGQTCVAPDYVLVPQEKQQSFIQAYRDAFSRLYPSLNSGDYSAIINTGQLNRLQSWLQDAENKGANVIQLAEDDLQNNARRLAPRLICDTDDKMTLMRQEIFGPLLPIVPYENLDDAIRYVQDRPRPLALYYFGHNKQDQQQILERTHSGGVCLNETVFHVAVDELPFGGIGPSGMGHYHGHEGFLTFSKAKSVLVKHKFSSSKLVLPPYNKWINTLIYRLFIR